MALVLDIREIPYDADLTVDALEAHANGYLRYQNFSDLVVQGQDAVQSYIRRANHLFRRKLERDFSVQVDETGELKLSYKTIFFRDEKQGMHEALPMTDFLRFSFQDGGKTKSGFGIFFSSYAREIDRKKLESANPIDEIDASAAIYQMMFKDKFPI